MNLFIRRDARRPRGLIHAAVLGLSLTAMVVTACTEEQEQELARAMIGPEGGSISGGGMTIEFPAGALPVETEIVLRRSSTPLTIGEYSQRGDGVSIEPSGLRLALPATVSVDGGDDGSSVLVEAAGRTVAHPGDVAYVEYLGNVALARSGTPTITVVEPELGSSPSSPGGNYVDNLHFELDLAGTHRVDLIITAWDFSGEQTVLNGKGHCGFKLAQLEGGSLTTGCANGKLTASINAAGDHVSFDVLPLHAPAIDDPVSVGVIAGDEQLGYALGYFQFDTGNCYLEECSGNGVCVVDGGEPQCECIEGFAQPMDDPLACACVPQCDGRECGSDSCGGSCGNCGAGEMCGYSEGQCVPEDTGDGDGDPGDGDGDPGDGDGDPGDGDGDPGDGDGDPGDGDGDPGDGDGDPGDGDGDMP